MPDAGGRITAGMGQVVVLKGEAGIGKSRLVRELKDHVAREAHLCLECRASPYSQHTAWYPIVELLQRWLQWPLTPSERHLVHARPPLVLCRQRRGRKNARTSSTNRSGSSMGAKWPPAGITVQRLRL